MKILHYCLGFPPFRTGGMTTFCIDLMKKQASSGHEVGLLWPGKFSVKNNTTKIKTKRPVVYNENEKLLSFELVNGLPVPLLNGIKDTDAFCRGINQQVFESFFEENKIDILHVHTLMGFPIECLKAAKKYNIKTIFTAHDYFGICFKWGMYCGNQICEDNMDCKKCVSCNETALSLRKISILQSRVYRKLKNNFWVKKMRKKHNLKLSEAYSNDALSDNTESSEKADCYIHLREYYLSMLKLFEVIHWNSKITKNVYEKYMGEMQNGMVFPVSHARIENHIIKARQKHSEVNIGYLGPLSCPKGYYFAMQIFNDLYCSGLRGFKLHIFHQFDHDKLFVVNHNPYQYDDLKKVMDSIDLVIVPSQWYETYGFTVAEALSYGVPVVVTENVGAKDLIQDGENGYVLPSTSECWKEKIKELISYPEKIQQMMNNLSKMKKIGSYDDYYKNYMKNIYECV